ncbi:hypothetical protein Ancab_000129 [Ancistrocladus abbreviatus]
MELHSYLNFHALSLSSKQTPNKDPSHWTSIIRRHAKFNDDPAILTTYSQMEALNISPDSSALPVILKACSKLQAIETGKRVHSKIKNKKLIDDVRVRTALIDFYFKCGFVRDARHLFDEMADRDVVSWNTVINGYMGFCQYKEAISLFMKMRNENLKPTSVTFVALIVACGETLELRLGQEIHGHCLRNGLLDTNHHLGAALIGFYQRFDLSVCRTVFDLMIMRNVVCWNTMIKGYFDAGDYFEALHLFIQMLEEGVSFDDITILSGIQTCSELGSLDLGMQMHQLAIKFRLVKDSYIINTLLNMYGKNGSLESAYKLFECVPARDSALWNSMISSYFEFGFREEAWSMFNRMQSEGVEANENTVTVLLSMCTQSVNKLAFGKSLHAKVIRNRFDYSISIGNALLRLYAELNHIEDALKIFSELTDLDVISFNTIILALARGRLRSQAWNYFQQTLESEIKPNSHTIISILAACDDQSCLNVGRSLHGYMTKCGIEMNVELNTALTEMYMKCGDETTGRYLFDRCVKRDQISWNSLIASYMINDQPLEAILLFRQMISEIEPSSVTVISVLGFCTHVSCLPFGQSLHAYTLRREFFVDDSKMSLANALISMYARCGSMQNAEKIFKTMGKREIISWNALVSGYGLNGQVYDALRAFKQMLEDDIRPNGITFLSLLSCCSHSGMIDIGVQLFEAMTHDLNIAPTLFHYGCMVDLFGRAGCIDEAREIIDSMPFEPDASVWRALLTACRLHSEVNLAKFIFEKLVEIEPLNPGNYILLSNVYATAGLWSEVRDLRTLLKEKGLRKHPGISRIFVRSEVHCFLAEDQSHPRSAEIFATLNSLFFSLKDYGYIPDLSWVLHDGEDDNSS